MKDNKGCLKDLNLTGDFCGQEIRHYKEGKEIFYKINLCPECKKEMEKKGEE